jgi:hypothetical protein
MKKNKKKTSSFLKQQLGIIKQWVNNPPLNQKFFYKKFLKTEFIIKYVLYWLGKMGINSFMKQCDRQLTIKQQYWIARKLRQRLLYLTKIVPQFNFNKWAFYLLKKQYRNLLIIYKYWRYYKFYKRMWRKFYSYRKWKKNTHYRYIRIKRRFTQKDKKRKKNFFHTIPKYFINAHITNIYYVTTLTTKEITVTLLLNLVELYRKKRKNLKRKKKFKIIYSYRKRRRIKKYLKIRSTMRLSRYQYFFIRLQLVKLLVLRIFLEKFFEKTFGELITIKFKNLFITGICGPLFKGLQLIPEFRKQRDLNNLWHLSGRRLIKTFRWKQKKRYRFLTLFKYAFLIDNLEIILSLIIEWFRIMKKQRKTFIQLLLILNTYYSLSPSIVGLQILLCGKLGGNRRTVCKSYQIGKKIHQQTLLTPVSYFYDIAETYTGSFGIHIWIYHNYK